MISIRWWYTKSPPPGKAEAYISGFPGIAQEVTPNDGVFILLVTYCIWTIPPQMCRVRSLYCFYIISQKSGFAKLLNIKMSWVITLSSSCKKEPQKFWGGFLFLYKLSIYSNITLKHKLRRK